MSLAFPETEKEFNQHRSATQEGVNPKEIVGSYKAPIHLIPPALLVHTSVALEDGAWKYGEYNYRQTKVKLTTYINGIYRHLMCLLDGEDLAADSLAEHMGHIAAGCGIVLDAKANGMLVDDRPPKGKAPELLEDARKLITAKMEDRRAKEESSAQGGETCCGQYAECGSRCSGG
jgi:hypothetical protein